jgi:hypothetical protein
MKRHLSLAAINPQENKWDKIEGIWNDEDLYFSLLPPSAFISSELPISLLGNPVKNPLCPYPPMYQGWVDKCARDRKRFTRGDKESSLLQGKMEKEFGSWLIESGTIYEVTGLFNVEKDVLNSAV